MSDHYPDMPGGDHTGGELVAVQTHPTSGLGQGRELGKGFGEGSRPFGLVLGGIDWVLIEPDVMSSADNSPVA